MFRALATRSPFINFQQGKPLARAEYNEAGTKSPPLLPLSTSSGGSLKFQVGGVFGSNSEVAISRSIWRVPRWKERRRKRLARGWAYGARAVVRARRANRLRIGRRWPLVRRQCLIIQSPIPRSAFRPTAAQSVRTISLRNSRRWTHNRRLPVIHRLKIRL